MAPGAIDRNEFHEAVRQIREDIHGTNDRLDTLNGRTLGNERAIATEKTNIAVLTTRVDTVERMTSASARWWHRLSGSAAAAAVALVLEYAFNHLK